VKNIYLYGKKSFENNDLKSDDRFIHSLSCGEKTNYYKVNEYIKERGEKIVQEFLEKEAMILCRKNKEVKAIQQLGYSKAQTIHQAKGLEYEYVIVTDFEVRGIEDINISYVAMTRAGKGLLAANYTAFYKIMEKLSEEDKLNQIHKLF
jgi:ATP-dependent exoDNAse (exonuclease V) beta subunit